MLTQEEIKAIKAREKGATPGLWRHEKMPDTYVNPYRIGNDEYVLIEVVLSESDAEFIAHAREDIPALMDALEAETARADAAEKQRDIAKLAVGFGGVEKYNEAVTDRDIWYGEAKKYERWYNDMNAERLRQTARFAGKDTTHEAQ